jgi:uncharacterized membrane protein YoaK (UPF0700 family)
MTARLARWRPTLGRDAMLLLLTWAAGSMDAIGYLGLGNVFTAMMTGNTVLLALAIGEGRLLGVLRSALALAGFVAGALVGAVVAERGDKREPWPASVTAALAIEACVLALFTVIWSIVGYATAERIAELLIVLASGAMGMQAAAVRRLGVPGVGTTYITGTLTSLVGDVVVWVRSSGRPTGAPDTLRVANIEQRVGLLAAVFSVYGIGALVASVLLTRSSLLANLSALLAVALVVVNAIARRRMSAD